MDSEGLANKAIELSRETLARVDETLEAAWDGDNQPFWDAVTIVMKSRQDGEGSRAERLSAIEALHRVIERHAAAPSEELLERSAIIRAPVQIDVSIEAKEDRQQALLILASVARSTWQMGVQSSEVLLDGPNFQIVELHLDSGERRRARLTWMRERPAPS